MEEIGFDSLWMSDSAAGGTPSAMPTLAAIAMRTEKLKLGTSVLVLPPRNPVLLAKELATVDVISGGRLLVIGGLGIGTPNELAAFGISREDRVGRLEESVEIIHRLWPGEPVTYSGKYWSLQEVTLAPKPVRGRIELWLAAETPVALRRAGRIADGWLTAFIPPERFADGIDTIQEHARAAGRSIDDDHYGATVFAAASPEDLPAQARALIESRPAGEQLTLTYGADQLRETLIRYCRAGASKFVVNPIARDLIPWLREIHQEVVTPVEGKTWLNQG
jgi:probable F420-dependent oxidoreductase